MAEEGKEEGAEVEAFRKAIANRIVNESDRLVQELFAIAYDPDADAKVRLSAINTLLDRALPKLGVQHQKQEETEERGSRKQLREEIEKLLKDQDEDPEDE